MLRPFCFWSSFSLVIQAIGRHAVSSVEAVGRVGHFLSDMLRALPDVRTWARPTIVQMRRAGLALAGRVGASMAAELGTMKVTEQVDALETLAYDPQSYLVVPRVLAGTLMFPMIIAFAVATGIVTGWLTSLVLLDLSTPDFLKGLKLFYRFKDTWFGLFKSATFGATITLVGCVVGLSTRGGAEGVGKSTTRAVVYSAVLILLLDAFWAVLLL